MIKAPAFPKAQTPYAKAKTTLELKQLSKAFASSQGNHTAVRSIDLKVNQGEFVTLLGPSGCGKTTTLRLIAGFETPTSGDILLDDKIITYESVNKRPMTMVFQSYALFPHMTVYDNICYGLRVKGLKRELSEKVEMVMQIMNLAGLEQRMPHQISGGQQQRVALARALVVEPRVLLFDEPLSNLDAKLRVQMRTEIRRLQKRLGITSIYVTHDQAEAMALSDRIVVMNHGKIEQVGSPADIYQKPATTFVADFMGRSNFIKSTVLSSSRQALCLDLYGQKMILNADATFSVGDVVNLIVRPEAVRLSSSPTKTALKGEVRQVEYLGPHVDYEVELPDGTFILAVMYNPAASKAFYEEGSEVWLEIESEALHVLPVT
jgi:iron(III) transport system ATP-binding protein